jgi:DNA-binding NarL/FixJ family response regulator
VIIWKENDHRRNPGRHPDPERPTPRELKALHAVQDGVSLAVAGARMGLSAQAIGSILSHAYDRLKIPKRWSQHLSQERRYEAIRICKDHGWWDE